MKITMKKILFLAAVLLAAAAVSCSRPTGVGSESEASPGGEGGAPYESTGTGADTSAYDENGFLIFPDGNYIKEPAFDTDDPLPDFDAPTSFAQLGNSSSHSMCEAANGWYSCSTDSGCKDMVLFTDKKTGASIPLCGKPECMHDSRSCNAYFGRIERLQLYDGYLYVIADDSVFRVLPDGTKRESVTVLSREASDAAETDSFYQIHRGYLYVCGSKWAVENGKDVHYASVTAHALDGSEEFRLFEKKYEEGAMPRVNVRFCGNDVYIMAWHTGDTSTGTDAVCYADFYRWDAETRLGEALFTGTYPENIRPYQFDCMVREGDGIYIGVGYRGRLAEGEENAGSAVTTRLGVMKYSFDTKKPEHVMWFNDDPGDVVGSDKTLNGTLKIVFTADKIIFADYDAETLLMFDTDGREVFRRDGFTYANFTGGSEKYLYFYNIEGGFYRAVPLGEGGADDVVTVGIPAATE